jgi:hypothetical protein
LGGSLLKTGFGAMKDLRANVDKAFKSEEEIRREEEINRKKE